jgi:hypothetical protein
LPHQPNFVLASLHALNRTVPFGFTARLQTSIQQMNMGLGDGDEVRQWHVGEG